MSCWRRSTLAFAFLVLAIVHGSTRAHETGEEETCHLTVARTKTRIGVKPRVFLRGKLHGVIDSSNEDLHSTVWRIICRSPTTVLTIALKMNLSNGDYLQVKKTVLGGCVDLPWTNHFNKSSILVARAPSANETANSSTFQLGYLCMGSSSANLATRIFFNNEVLQYLKTHGTEAFFEAAELITVPQSIFHAYEKEHSGAILNIINSPAATESSTGRATGN